MPRPHSTTDDDDGYISSSAIVTGLTNFSRSVSSPTRKTDPNFAQIQIQMTNPDCAQFQIEREEPDYA